MAERVRLELDSKKLRGDLTAALIRIREGFPGLVFPSQYPDMSQKYKMSDIAKECPTLAKKYTTQVTVPRARSRRLQRALPVVQSASPAGAARIPGMRKKDVIESTGAHSHWLSESI